MVHKAEGGCHLPGIDVQSLASTKKLETSTEKGQIFYLIRSGAQTGGIISSGYDIDRAACSQKDNPIPQQMRAYAERLDICWNSKIVVASSTAKRAIDTAEPFVSVLKEKGLDVIFLQTEELMERSVGKQEGRSRTDEEYRAKVEAWKTLSAEEKFREPEMQDMGYETFKDVAARVINFLERIAKENPGATFFVFTHVHSIEASAITLSRIELSHIPGSHMPLEHLEPLEALMLVRTENSFYPTSRLTVGSLFEGIQKT